MNRNLTAKVYQSSDPFADGSKSLECRAEEIFLEDGDMNSALTKWFRGWYSDQELIDKLNSLKASSESIAEDEQSADYMEGA